MVFPPGQSTSDRLSRFSAGMALVLAAGAGLVVAWWVPRPPQETRTPSESTPILTESAILPAADIPAIIRFCATHTSERRGFVVFSEGSVVLVSEPCADPISQAEETLRRCAKPDAVFVTEPTTAADLVVTFTEPVFQWIPAKHRETLAEWGERHLDTLFSPAELAKKSGDWKPGADACVGLVARSRLLEDAKSAKVVKVIRPAPETKPAPPTEAPIP